MVKYISVELLQFYENPSTETDHNEYDRLFLILHLTFIEILIPHKC